MISIAKMKTNSYAQALLPISKKFLNVLKHWKVRRVLNDHLPPQMGLLVELMDVQTTPEASASVHDIMQNGVAVLYLVMSVMKPML